MYNILYSPSMRMRIDYFVCMSIEPCWVYIFHVIEVYKICAQLYRLCGACSGSPQLLHGTLASVQTEIIGFSTLLRKSFLAVAQLRSFSHVPMLGLRCSSPICAFSMIICNSGRLKTLAAFSVSSKPSLSPFNST